MPRQTAAPTQVMTDGMSNIRRPTGCCPGRLGRHPTAPAGWLTVGGGAALGGPRRVVPTAGAGPAPPAAAPQEAPAKGCTLLVAWGPGSVVALGRPPGGLPGGGGAR